MKSEKKDSVSAIFKKRNQVLFSSEKLKIVNVFEWGKSRNEILCEFGLPEISYHEIIKLKDSIKCFEGHENIKRSRQSEFIDIENCLLEWIKKTFNKNFPTDGPLLKQKFKDCHKIGNFRVVNGSINKKPRFVGNRHKQKNIAVLGLFLIPVAAHDPWAGEAII